MEPELATILDDGYLAGIDALPIATVREMRRNCQAVETDVSYLRRLVQGRLDIASTELARRRDGGDPADLSALIARLPAVLADRTRGTGTGRLPTVFAAGDVRGELAEELATIDVEARFVELDTVDSEALVATSERLTDLEQRVSTLRRDLFARIDALGEELARRYRSGEASLGDLLRRAE